MKSSEESAASVAREVFVLPSSPIFWRPVYISHLGGPHLRFLGGRREPLNKIAHAAWPGRAPTVWVMYVPLWMPTIAAAGIAGVSWRRVRRGRAAQTSVEG